MPSSSAPLMIAALDAGSNAIRTVIARASSATEIRELASARWPVRLGHGAFTRKRLDSLTMRRAVKVFENFSKLLDRYEVTEYSAVATSAVREASNRETLVSLIRRKTGVELSAIDAAEESRLARIAVFSASTPEFAPQAIADLGGGSLEISFLRGRRVFRELALPLGSVRLMEGFHLAGSFTPAGFAKLRRHVSSVLKSRGRSVSAQRRSMVVACGGNAEALARLVPGRRIGGFNTINLARLEERLWEIARMDIDERIAAFGVRRDRAEVIGVAAVVLAGLGEWIGASHLIVPGVGVREGILHDLAAAHFGPASSNDERAEGLREQARRFAERMHSEAPHCEQVRRLSAQLFDGLTPVHGMAPGHRVTLEMGALLHDVGRVVNAQAHHKHGEYLVGHADIPGLGKHHQTMVACLVRYHGKATPEAHHRQYRALAPRERRIVRILAGMLKIAVALDSGDRQAARRVEIKIDKKDVRIRIYCPLGAFIDFSALKQHARLFCDECSVRVRFERARWMPASLQRPNHQGARSDGRTKLLPRKSAA